MAYFEMASLDSGTSVKILPELNPRSFNLIKSLMPDSEDRATA